MARLLQNPDVIIIGAGAAGLAAGQALIEGGKSVVVLEAADRRGGRCFTDTASFGIPFDRGGSWLHSTDVNPLATKAENAGFNIIKEKWRDGSVSIEGRHLDDRQRAEYIACRSAVLEAPSIAGAKGLDVSAAEVLPDSPWRDTARHFIAQISSRDAEHISTMDEHRFDWSGGDWLLQEGYGTLIAALGGDVGVELSCPAEYIDWSGKDIVVSTPKGDLHAAKVIITVSTGVLASGKIGFHPALPVDKGSAIAALPMGVLNKTAMLLDPALVPSQDMLIHEYHPCSDQSCIFFTRFAGTPLTIAFTAGSFGEDLEAAGPDATLDFCRQGLSALFGANAAKSIRKTRSTAWKSDPFVLGGYSAALPGRADARHTLAQPVEDRIYFAGEATIPQAYATVHGAHMSGLATAAQILSG